MKRIFLLAVVFAGLIGGSLAAQTIQLKISLDATLLGNPDCWLNQGVVNNDKVYLHSGLCSSDPVLCSDSICNPGSDIWQDVIGNWGLDDNVGLMTYDGNLKWSLTMIPTTYYNQPTATPYAIGLVFRNDDGTFEGKNNSCQDIFIKGINTATPVVMGCDQQPIPAVTVERTVMTGLNNPSYLGGLRVSPNPATDHVTIDYNLQKKANAFEVAIYSSLGQKVLSIAQGSQAPGSHRLEWNGRDAAAQMVGNGLYYMVMTNGSELIATEKILMMR